MRNGSLLGFALCVVFITSSAVAEECFIVSKNNKTLYIEGACDKRYTPASTFKLVISLMGFDANILMDETHPTWDFKAGYVDGLAWWKQPHNPKMWLANSCVWYSQVITKKLGEKKFSEYIYRFRYGNQDISGDKDMHNGLTDAWLSSSLAISPKEQIAFLNKLVANALPVSVDAQEKTKNILPQEMLPNGWVLYGKTGSGSQLDADGNKIKDRQVGWYVGFARKGDVTLPFVQLLADDANQDTYASLRAKATLKNRMKNILLGMDDAR